MFIPSPCSVSWEVETASDLGQVCNQNRCGKVYLKWFVFMITLQPVNEIRTINLVEENGELKNQSIVIMAKLERD